MTLNDVARQLKLSKKDLEKLRSLSWSTDGGEVLNFINFLVEVNSNDEVENIYYPENKGGRVINKSEFLDNYGEIMLLFEDYIPIEVVNWVERETDKSINDCIGGI